MNKTQTVETIIEHWVYEASKGRNVAECWQEIKKAVIPMQKNVVSMQTVEERFKKIDVTIGEENCEVINLYKLLSYYERKTVLAFIQSEIKANDDEWREAIKKHRPVFFKNDIKSLMLMDSNEIMVVREVLRIEILEEMGVDCSKMRKKLKVDNQK